MSVLLTGGLGYIGSHTCVSLLESGEDVIILDNLSNSKIEVLDAIKKITGKDVRFYKCDASNYEESKKIFEENKIDSVVHFAGYKAVGESVAKPLEYYQNNIYSMINILNLMKEFNVKNLVFSSSATVYGQAKTMPIDETFPTGATNPYGRTKLYIENILMDIASADKSFNFVILRYFNPIGAHPSGYIGEDPNGIPNNLMPYIVKVATGKLPVLNVFGDDYDTPDGTGIRDYIHIMDLADGHVKALKKCREKCGLKIYNLGSGSGYSVLEIVNTFNRVCPQKCPYVFAPRRPGDISICYAKIEKAKEELNWEPKHTLEDMCYSSYNFGVNHSKKDTILALNKKLSKSSK